MISHLRALIAAAIKEIEELEIKIKKAEEELEKCYQLKPILSRINSNALNGVVVNYSLKDTRRVDMLFSIAYENDFRKAKAIIFDEIEKTKLALNDPLPFVNIKTHNSSSIDIVVRVWVKSADYWNFYWLMLESVKLAFDKNGISIPYNQMDIHMKDDSKLPNPIDEQDPYVKEEIQHYHTRLQSMYDLKRKREEELAAEQEMKENKNIVKYLSKKTKQKKKNKEKVEG